LRRTTDDQSELATGTLLTVDNQIDQTTGTAKFKSVFDNKNNALWPNQFVNVRLLLETRKDAVAIPAAAIQRGPQGTYVFTVKPDNTVEVRPVTVAFTEDNVSAINSGISANDEVVTDGQDKLQAGSKVEIRQPSGQPQNAGASGANSPNAADVPALSSNESNQSAGTTRTGTANRGN
jgi:multidrug efflux system membrane fusion protein